MEEMHLKPGTYSLPHVKDQFYGQCNHQKKNNDLDPQDSLTGKMEVWLTSWYPRQRWELGTTEVRQIPRLLQVDSQLTGFRDFYIHGKKTYINHVSQFLYFLFFGSFGHADSGETARPLPSQYLMKANDWMQRTPFMPIPLHPSVTLWMHIIWVTSSLSSSKDQRWDN